jgi:hypothetical protein
MAGGPASLRNRGIEVVLDDLGRPAISREAFGELIAERNATEAKRVEEDRRRAEEAVQRKTVLVGTPAQEGMSAVEAMVSQDPAFSTPSDDFGPGFGSPTRELLEAELAAGRRRLAERRAEGEAKQLAIDKMKKDLQ